MNSRNSLIHSYFVPQGPQIHRGSGLYSAGLGSYPQELQEISLSSSWLFKSSGQKVTALRFSLTFPDEWSRLDEELKVLESHFLGAFDLWIFRNLTLGEKKTLLSCMDNNSRTRLVIAVNHLMDWKDFCYSTELLSFVQKNRVLLSFLPQTNDLGPFLKPQEILLELERLEKNFPILVPHFYEQKENSFYQTLTPEGYILELKHRRAMLSRTLRWLDRTGFHLVILSIESLLSYLLERRPEKLSLATKYLYNFVVNTVGKIIRAGIYIFKILFWYRCLFRILIFVRYRLPVVLLFFLYPIRKIYWFCSFQYKKRILCRVEKDEA